MTTAREKMSALAYWLKQQDFEEVPQPPTGPRQYRRKSTTVTATPIHTPSGGSVVVRLYEGNNLKVETNDPSLEWLAENLP